MREENPTGIETSRRVREGDSHNMPQSQGAPRVSLGLPVHNGERFIRQAIEAILAQTYTDYELIISDNASSDRTAEICEDYAKCDARIRYCRTEENVGAGPNFNRTFEMATGEYFKWVAHDDLHKPTFLEECVKVLDQDPGIVVAYSKVEVIDEHGESLESYSFEVGADANSPWRRLQHQIRGHQCYEIFGVIRRATLAKTRLMGSYFAGDAVLLIRLGLMGRLVEVPEHLFLSRRHATQSESMRRDVQAYTTWFHPGKGRNITLPYWRVMGEYLRSVWQARISPLQKPPCYFLVMCWAARRWKHLLKDLARATAQLLGRLFYSAAPARPSPG